MPARIILTFTTLHQVLAAEKVLKTAPDALFRIRPTPTPPGLSTSICGMSIEILASEQKQPIIDYLKVKDMQPSGVYITD